MIRSGCIGLCAGLALSLFSLGCGSSNSSGAGGSSGGGAGGGGSSGTSLAPWDTARIGNAGTAWKVLLIKDRFYYMVKLGISDVTDMQGRTQTVSMSKVVAEKSGSTASLPKPEEMPGKWINDPDATVTSQGPIVATDKKKIEDDYIDGGAAPFYTSNYSAKTFVWANYIENDASKDSPLKLELWGWEMNSAADAKALYGDLLNNSLYSNTDWTTCVAKDASNLCP